MRKKKGKGGKGGFFTPASALGHDLIRALRDTGYFSFDVSQSKL